MTEEALATLSLSSGDEEQEEMQMCKSSGQRQVQEMKCNYKWSVHKSSLRAKKTGENIKSPTFTVGTSKWYILLYPKGDREKYKHHISLFLNYVPYDERAVQANFKFSIVNKMGEKINTLDSSAKFHKQQRTCLGSAAFICTDKVLNNEELLPDDRLTILCEINIVFDQNPSSATQIITPECHLLNDLRLMFENQQLSDVILSVGEKEFQAHKAILAARSPVFKAMFIHDMEEKQHNQIDISDIDSETIEGMLQFIYTGKVFNIEKIATNLLAAADKYELETLKVICEKFIYNNKLRMENAIELLVLADLHRAKQLKGHSMNFIIVHSVDLVKTPEWKSFITTYPGLLEELFKAAAYV